MSVSLTLKHPDLANVRKWRIKGFDNHLIFYEPRLDQTSADLGHTTIVKAANAWGPKWYVNHQTSS